MKTLRHFDIAQCKLHSVRGFFFCISFILLFTSLSFPQSVRDEIKKIGGSPQFNKAFEPINLPIDTTTTSVFFYGDKITTKVAKDSGGVSVKPYMRVWSDSTGEVIVNGNFATNDSTGWNFVGTWLISSNKLLALTGGRATIDTTLKVGVHYKFTFDKLVNVAPCSVYNGSTLLRVFTTVANNNTVFFTATNTNFHIISASLPSYDNFSIIPVADSTNGYTHNLTRPDDTTTYYYSQSVKWVQKDKDIIWLAAETDTVTVYPYIEPQPDNINYMRTVDGDTMFTAEGDTMKTTYNFNFNKTNGEKNEEDIILPQRVYAVLDSKRTMGFTV